MNNSHIVYVQRDGITPEAGISALANIYKFVLDKPRPDGATVKNNREVSNVEHRPD